MSRQQELIERISKLSPGKQALLKTRLNGGQGEINSSGRLALAAFVTAAADQVPSVDQLGDLLRRSLPDYMVPTSITVLEEFPLLPNGKVDVAALSVTRTTVKRQSPEQPVNGDEEIMLIDIWRKVLQTDYIDVEDNFFEMGGDSLLGMMMVSRAHQVGLAVELLDLFRYPTIAQLGGYLREKATATECS